MAEAAGASEGVGGEAAAGGAARRDSPDALHKGLRIAGHPVHPALTHAPIGLFFAALPADIIGALGGGEFFFRAAWWLLLGGLIAAVPTALTGMFDWWKMDRDWPVRRIATAHMVVNVVAVAIYLASLLVRSFGEMEGYVVAWALALNALGFVLLLVGGTLGGTMIFKHRVGCDPSGVHRDEPERRAPGA